MASGSSAYRRRAVSPTSPRPLAGQLTIAGGVDRRTANAQKASVEAQRAANTCARVSGAYQEGIMTLQRLRTGGKQVVQVQYVIVGSEGSSSSRRGLIRGFGRKSGKMQGAGTREIEHVSEHNAAWDTE